MKLYAMITHSTFLKRSSLCLFLLLVWSGSLRAAAGTGPADPVALPDTVDPRAWQEVDIVPMPKEIRLTDEDLVLDPETVVLVLGREPSDRSAFGAKWINRRIVETGGRALPIRDVDADIPAGTTRLLVGTPDDNPLIAEAVRQGVVRVGPNDPGPRGYEIRRRPDGATVYLAGADPMGALYACVTLGELLEPRGARPVWRAAEVRDWPDFQYLSTGRQIMPPLGFGFRRGGVEVTEEMRREWLDYLEEEYAWMLRRKESLLRWTFPRGVFQRLRALSDSQIETLRAGIDLGRRYGIDGLYYALTPYPGLKEDFPDAGDEHELHDSRFDRPRNRDSRTLWWRSWSLPDAFARRTAAELAGYIRDLGFADVGFHDTDTGGLGNPAEWAKRSDADRARWGDDYAAATMHRHRIYFEEFTKADPDIRLHFTLYPYHIMIFDENRIPGSPVAGRQHGFVRPGQSEDQITEWRRKYGDFYRRLDESFPRDTVSFVIREDTPGAFMGFRSLMQPGRPVFHWYGIRTPDLYPDMFIRGFLGSPNDVFSDMVAMANDGVQVIPLRRLLSREYTWNTHSPSLRAIEVDEDGTLKPWVRDLAGANTTVLLPRLVRNLFGRPLAAEIAQALSLELRPAWLFYHHERVFDNAVFAQVNVFHKGPEYYDFFEDNPAALARQRKAGEEAAAIMDRAWRKLGGAENRLGLEARTLERVMYLREYAHTCRWISALAQEVQFALDAADAGVGRSAQARLEKAEEIHAEARRSLAALKAERPEELADFSYLYCAATTLDMLGASEDGPVLTTATGMVKTRLQQVAVPPDVIDRIRARTEVPVLRVNRVPEMDGRLDGEAWQGAYPTEALFVLRAGPVVDVASRVRMVHDGERLAIGFQAYLPAGRTEVEDNDRMEFYLDARDAGGTALLAVLRAGGRFSLHTPNNGGWANLEVPGAKAHIVRGTGHWQGHISLPLAALGAELSDAWRFAVLRAHVTSAGQERSASMVTGPDQNPNNLFSVRDSFLRLNDTARPFTPRIRTESESLQFRSVTLDDGIATSLRFRVRMESDVLLDNPVLWADVRGPEGKKLARRELASRDRLLYRWHPEDMFEVIVLEGNVEEATLHLQVESDQGVFSSAHPIRPSE